MNDYLVIGLLVGSITGVFMLGMFYDTATAQEPPTITINSFTAKIVVSFERPGLNEEQIRNYLIDNIWPDVRDLLITKLDNNFESYTLEKDLEVYKVNTDRWEIYPKFVISGETTLTKQQLRNGFDNTLDQIKSILQTHIELQGGTDIIYHIHKSVGSIDE